MLQAASRGPITRIHLARTVLGRPLRIVEAYLVDGLLIETGPPATASEMVNWCREQDIRQVVNTHHHEDHSGGNRGLQTRLELPIAAPSESVALLRNPPRLESYRRLVWGQPEGTSVRPLGSSVETPSYRFRVIPTPGHSTDHVCFFEPEEGWLFSGDLFIHEHARYLRVDEDAHQILASLRRVSALRPRLLACSHAGFVDDGCSAIERKIAYWEGLAEQARILRESGSSLKEIAEALLGREGLPTHLSRGHFSKRNLLNSLLAETETEWR